MKTKRRHLQENKGELAAKDPTAEDGLNRKFRNTPKLISKKVSLAAAHDS